MSSKSNPCTQEQFDEICKIVAIEYTPLRDICIRAGTDKQSFYEMLHSNKENADLYARAKELQCAAKYEQLNEIANEPLPTTASGSLDSAAVQDKRLRIDTLKWELCKLIPKKYGEKVDVTTDGDKIQSIQWQVIPCKREGE